MSIKKHSDFSHLKIANISFSYLTSQLPMICGLITTSGAIQLVNMPQPHQAVLASACKSHALTGIIPLNTKHIMDNFCETTTSAKCNMLMNSPQAGHIYIYIYMGINVAGFIPVFLKVVSRNTTTFSNGNPSPDIFRYSFPLPKPMCIAISRQCRHIAQDFFFIYIG